MYHRILALFSAEPYIPPWTSADEDEAAPNHLNAVNSRLAAHLTNTSLQVERGEAGVRLLDELEDCHLLAPPENPNESAFVTNEGEILGSQDLENIKAQITDLLAETFKAALDMSIHFQVSFFPHLQ